MNNTDVQMLMKMLMQVICMAWNRKSPMKGFVFGIRNSAFVRGRLKAEHCVLSRACLR